MFTVYKNRFNTLKLKYSKEGHLKCKIQLVKDITDNKSDIKEYEEDEIFKSIISDNKELNGTENIG